MDIAEKIRQLRKEYQNSFEFNDADMLADPFAQFSQWFEIAVKSGIAEPNAMTLATVGKDLRPSARIVLVKDFSSAGMVFYTNYKSEKGLQLAENSQAALLFYWPELERQVRIAGNVSKVSREQSERYFASRPRGAQFGAAVSSQSQVIPSRKVYEQRLSELERSLADQPVPCPADWGGYLLTPDYFEFWQGRENRLHDRMRYCLDGNQWHRQRLSA